MRSHDQLYQRKRVGSAAHILLHQPHAARRFYIKTTAVERDAFAHNRDAWVARVAPFQLNQPRGMFARCCFADSVNERIASFQRFPCRHCHIGLMRLGDALSLSPKRIGTKVTRRTVDQIAHQRRCARLKHDVIDLTRFTNKQHARAGYFRFAEIFMVSILTKHPPKHRFSSVGIQQPIASLGQNIR